MNRQNILINVCLNLAVFTRVTGYLDWIETVKNNPTILTGSETFALALTSSQVNHNKLSYLFIIIELLFFILNKFSFF